MKKFNSGLRLFWMSAAMAVFIIELPADQSGPCDSSSRVDGRGRVLVTKTADGTASLKMETKDGARDLKADVIGDSWQTCRSLPGSLLLFGRNDHTTLYEIFRIDPTTGNILDKFWGYTPSLSPDGRWVLMRRMYPVQAPGATDDYLLYDAAASPSENRRHSISRADPNTAGSPVYPVLRDDEFRDNTNLPEDGIHAFRSDTFYWTPDSKCVSFADLRDGQLNLVLIKTDGNTPQTFVYPFTAPPSDDCLLRASPTGGDMDLVDFRFPDLPGNSFAVHAELRPRRVGQDVCPTKSIDVPFSSFVQALPEHRAVTSRKPSEGGTK